MQDLRRSQAAGVMRRALLAAMTIAFATACYTGGLQAQAEAETADSLPIEPPAKHTPPGLFGSVGRWMDEYLAVMGSSLKEARGRFESLGEQATGMAKDLSRIPSASVVTGRERCEVAPNGAPDCRAATEALCRTKGFAKGRSVDVQLAQKCPAQAWFGGNEARQQCKTESYVTRASCQ